MKREHTYEVLLTSHYTCRRGCSSRSRMYVVHDGYSVSVIVCFCCRWAGGWQFSGWRATWHAKCSCFCVRSDSIWAVMCWFACRLTGISLSCIPCGSTMLDGEGSSCWHARGSYRYSGQCHRWVGYVWSPALVSIHWVTCNYVPTRSAR